jgi:hypothetical protein
MALIALQAICFPQKTTSLNNPEYRTKISSQELGKFRSGSLRKRRSVAAWFH